MKKRLFSLILLLAISTSFSFGQLFIKVGGGYGIGASGDEWLSTISDSTGLTNQILRYGSNGEGGVFGAEVGYMFNDHLGVQLGAEYLVGARQGIISVQSPGMSLLQEGYSRQLRVLPAVIISSGAGGIDPYCRVGASLPLATTTFIEHVETDASGATPQSTNITTEITGKFVFGFHGAFGCNFSVGSRLAVFAEIGGVSQRLKGQTGEITRWDVDGTDILPTLNPFDKQWNYLEEINSNSNSAVLNPAIDPEQPEDRVQITQNLSSLFIKGGVTIFVGGVGADD